MIKTNELDKAITMQKAIYNGLKETGKDYPYRDELIPLMKESCLMSIKALDKQKELLQYAYYDICEWDEDYSFDGISDYSFVANVKDFIIN